MKLQCMLFNRVSRHISSTRQLQDTTQAGLSSDTAADDHAEFINGLDIATALAHKGGCGGAAASAGVCVRCVRVECEWCE